MNKIPFSRTKVAEFPMNYWNQINEFLALSPEEKLSGDALALHYLYWIYSETVNGTFVQYFENKGDLDQDKVLISIRTLGNVAYTESFEIAKVKFDEMTRLDEHFEENEDLIYELEDELFEIGIVYQNKPDALDFIESLIRNDEERYLEFLD